MATQRPYGVPVKDGIERTTTKEWQIIEDFLSSKVWWLPEPILEEDRTDPLLENNIPFGAFMLGFDFHLTPQGPKLIEINTNAGGLATVFTFAGSTTKELKCLERIHVEARFIEEIAEEFRIGREYFRNSTSSKSTLPSKITTVAIVDENVEKQGLYPEMLAFKEILEQFNIKAFVLSPESIDANEDFSLSYQGTRIDFIYNRITSNFRLANESHLHLRNAALHGQVVISPHPAAYVRIADKRNLLVLGEKIKQLENITFGDIVPQSFLLSDKDPEFWVKNKKNWVFKPAEGCGSKGVYRGDKISAAKLKTLPPDTVAQEFCPPSLSEDGTKLDFRVYSRSDSILGLATRHFTGQVMEMSSPKSGFKMALPDNVCCFPMVVDPALCAPFCGDDGSSPCTGECCDEQKCSELYF